MASRNRTTQSLLVGLAMVVAVGSMVALKRQVVKASGAQAIAGMNGLADVERLSRSGHTDNPVAARLAKQGIEHLRRGNYKAALKLYDKAIQIDPNAPSFHTHRSLAHFFLGNDNEALRDTQQALALDPDSYEAYGTQGLIHHKRGDFEQALTSANQAIALAPHIGDFHAQRGEALIALERPKEALTAFDQAIYQGVESGLVFLSRAIAHTSLGQFEAAIDDCDRVLNMNTPEGKLLHPKAKKLREALGQQQGESMI